MSPTTIKNLRVKIFADGADKAGILKLYELPYIQGFTTNPTLMRRAGIADYAAFARDVLAAVPDRPISFEVIADEFDEMERQARLVASWGRNVYVKIPVTNTRREPSLELVRRLSHGGVKVNVTAIMTLEQVRSVAEVLSGGEPSYISVFAGRMADTGRDPLPLMTKALELARVATEGRADLGQRPRAAQLVPRRFDRLPRDHLDPCHLEAVAAGGEMPGRVFARYGQDVFRGCP